MSKAAAQQQGRFLIIGAGGIGAYYGALLQQAGHRVVFIARGEHLQTMQSTGLTVRHTDFTFTEPVEALALEDLHTREPDGNFDYILLTTKAGTTAGILEDLGDWLSGTTSPILSLQNGIDNERQIAAAIGEARTLGGLAVRIGGHVVRPGVIEARGPAQIILGAWPNATGDHALQETLPRLVDLFCNASIPTRLSDDIRTEVWKKLLINNGVNPLSALTGMDTRTLSNHPDFSATVRRLMQEAAVAAASDGVSLSEQDVDAMLDLIQKFDPIKTSMLVDLEKGRPLELEEISGAVIECCRRIGASAPVSEAVHGLLRNRLEA